MNATPNSSFRKPKEGVVKYKGYKIFIYRASGGWFNYTIYQGDKSRGGVMRESSPRNVLSHVKWWIDHNTVFPDKPSKVVAPMLKTLEGEK